MESVALVLLTVANLALVGLARHATVRRIHRLEAENRILREQVTAATDWLNAPAERSRPSG